LRQGHPVVHRQVCVTGHLLATALLSVSGA
jgi:hypothetical protein